MAIPGDLNPRRNPLVLLSLQRGQYASERPRDVPNPSGMRSRQGRDDATQHATPTEPLPSLNDRSSPEKAERRESAQP